MNDDRSIFDVESITLVADGFAFAEGPLWDPQGFFYFADVRRDELHRVVPGDAPSFVRRTKNGNGLTFDLTGKLVQCEGDTRRLTRWDPATDTESVVLDQLDGKRLNRPNDVICARDGTLYFTDPGQRVPMEARDLDAAVWRIRPEGSVELVAYCEYPNGLAFSPDERRLYVANTRFQQYIHAIDLDASGAVVGRRIFADMSGGSSAGVPDGIKVDIAGNVYCTGAGGIWVFAPDGTHLATLGFAKPAVNMAFGGEDMKTMFVCAHDTLYTVRTRFPGLPSAWQQAAVSVPPLPA
ncbi:SMP-30/gluconolactonase/LRE family protein [Ottowia thiooxydans]|uniref:SMP-30/gluconolactonase/LRE family protein n=1 Tax=Ottowia thiooxydans TaxID=219182 RepID=UPI00041BDD1E|nr:SMP-30/gluconolactonase/LRE family protein [Ottowia thiooxydans]